MAYEIIKLSESFASYRNEVEDKEYIGDIPGVCNGWMFEYRNKDGEYNYSSVSYVHGSADDYANLYHTDDGLEWIHDTARYGGWEPTGRVVFRGYATEYYDPDEREWFVEQYDPADELAYIVAYA